MVSDDLKDNLIEILEQIRTLDDANARRHLMRGLPESLRNTHPFSSAKTTHLTNIVEHIANHVLSDTGQLALIILINNAQKHVQGLALEAELGKLRMALLSAQARQFYTPVAVIAMTRQEATTLTSETIFKHTQTSQDDYTKWQTIKAILKDTLKKQDISHLITHYHPDSRDEWQPLIATQPTSIKYIVQQLTEKLAAQNKTALPQYVSNQLLSSNQEKRKNARQFFEFGKGILIIDSLSMYHPLLRERFLENAPLFNLNKMTMIVISPFNLRTLPINKLLEKQIYIPHLSIPYQNYFETELHPEYEFGNGDFRKLQRWLLTTLRTFSPDYYHPSLETLTAIDYNTQVTTRDLLRKRITGEAK